MLIDHIGAVFTPDQFNGFRIIGRLAFPIFCFLLVEGFYHTHDVKRYIGRLGLFVLLSELPFDLAFSGMWSNQSQNVFFTLFIGMLVIYSMSLIKDKVRENDLLCISISLLVIVVGCYVADNLKTDYNSMGILLIVAFYLFRGEQRMLTMVAFVLLFGQYEIYAMFSMLLIYFYNGEKGPRMKYFFYVFYPGHLIILYLISSFINNKNPLQFLTYLIV